MYFLDSRFPAKGGLLSETSACVIIMIVLLLTFDNNGVKFNAFGL